MPNPPSILDTVLSNNGFLPDVAVRPLDESYRVPSDMRGGLLVDTLIQAMIETNKAARPAQSAAALAGYATLAEYADAHPEDVIAGNHQAHHSYLSAVYNLAKARTIKPLQTLVRRPLPETETNASDNSEQYFLDRHQTALAALLDLMAPGSVHQGDFGVHVAAVGAGKRKPCAAASPTPSHQPISATLSKLARLDTDGAIALAALAALEGNGVPRRTGGAWTMANWPTGDGGDYIEFTQAAPLATWSILHNLGRRPSAVMVVDSAGVQVLAETQHYSLNELRIYFGSPQTGAAYLS